MEYQILLPLLVLSFFFACSSDHTQLELVTEQGSKVILKNISFGQIRIFSEQKTVGISGSDSHGNPVKIEKGKKAFIATSEIPLETSNGLAVKMLLPKIPRGDRLIIDMELRLPQYILKDSKKTNKINAKFAFDEEYSNKERKIWWLFRNENPEYHIVGTWILSLYNKGKLLTSNRFHVKDVQNRQGR